MIDYIFSVLIITLIWTLLAQSYNLSFGLAGLFNLGHIVFFGLGAYVAAIFNTQFGVSFFANIFIGGLFSAVFASLLGLLTLRLSGHYLAIATLGIAMIASVIATNWFSVTRGPLGILGINNPMIGPYTFASEIAIFGLYLVIISVCLFILWRLFHSPFGRLLKALKDDELALQSCGKNIFKAKMWAFVLSAFFAGIAGVLYTHYRLFIDPTIFKLPEIILLILIVIIGGQGKFWGNILSALFVVGFLAEIPRFLGFPDHLIGGLRNALFGGLLMLIIFQQAGIFKNLKNPLLNLLKK